MSEPEIDPNAEYSVIELVGGAETPAEKIKEAHQAGVDSFVGGLRHFAEAGAILTTVRDSEKDFAGWCKDNLSFSRKTAYQYIQLAEKVQGGLDLDSGNFTSIRQVLAIDHDGENSTYQSKRTSDPRFESIPGLCSKLEQAYKEATRARPLTDWKDDEKRVLRGAMQPVVEIYQDLI